MGDERRGRLSLPLLLWAHSHSPLLPHHVLELALRYLIAQGFTLRSPPGQLRRPGGVAKRTELRVWGVKGRERHRTGKHGNINPPPLGMVVNETMKSSCRAVFCERDLSPQGPTRCSDEEGGARRARNISHPGEGADHVSGLVVVLGCACRRGWLSSVAFVERGGIKRFLQDTRRFQVGHRTLEVLSHRAAQNLSPLRPED